MAGKRREWSLLPRVSPFRDDAGMMCGFAVVRRPVGVAVSGGFGCPVVWCAERVLVYGMGYFAGCRRFSGKRDGGCGWRWWMGGCGNLGEGAGGSVFLAFFGRVFVCVVPFPDFVVCFC